MSFLNTIKFSKWWRPKIGSGIFTWILFSVLFNEKHSVETNLKTLILFTLLITLGILGHLINDASDYNQDLKAGKSNIFNKIGYRNSFWLIPIMALISLFLAYQLTTFVLYLTVIQIFFNCLYSFPPVRLKEKKWWALIITGFYERTIPYTIILFYLMAPADLTIKQILFLTTYLSWAYLWECRNFINGQFDDIDNDKKTHTISFAVQLGVQKLTKIKIKILNIELILLLIWVVKLVFFNLFFSLIFSIVLLLIIFLHYLSNDNLDYLSRFSNFIEVLYNHLFISSMVISAYIFNYLSLIIVLSILILFSSNLTVALFIKIYYFLFGITSFVVNHLIYYSRKLFRKNNSYKS